MLEIQTAVVNNPAFIELQHRSLRHFLTGEYSLTVFNDAKKFPDYSNFGDPGVHREIQRTCERLNIPCVDISNPSHASNMCAANRCADAMSALLDYQRARPAKYLVIDSDMFLATPTPTNVYDAWDAAIVPQVRSNDRGNTVRYFWNGVYYFNTARLPDMDGLSWRNNDVDGVWTDVGGAMHYWLERNRGAARIYEMPHKWSCKWGFDEFPAQMDARFLAFLMTDPRNPGDGTFFGELYDGRFLHFRAGGNWEKRSPNEYKQSVDALQQAFRTICGG
jgi:hypothetical protein